MTSTLTVSIDCTCGGRLRVSIPAIHASTAKHEREAFDQAHEVCRRRRYVPDPEPACTGDKDCEATTTHMLCCPAPIRGLEPPPARPGIDPDNPAFDTRGHLRALCNLCGPGYRIGDEGCNHTDQEAG